MKPQIDFKHVLGELSVNRNDPCEVIRELISNSYDAGATNMRYAAIHSTRSFVFWDNGKGLDCNEKTNGITPYEAFFSIGKSTKTKGDSIGYKCQGSKLCFASNRVLIISRTKNDNTWHSKVIENPRQTLDPETNIAPLISKTPWTELSSFLGTSTAEVSKVLGVFNQEFFETAFHQGLLVVVQGLEIENFARHLVVSSPALTSYLANYIRFSTRHGDTRCITEAQGFKPTQIKQVTAGVMAAKIELFDGNTFTDIPFGFPYLPVTQEIDIKSPLEVARLRDGRFSARYAKRIKFANNAYSLILAVDGNRRAHDGYHTLDRKGSTKSGLRLVDQRGLAASVNGIKVCKLNDMFLKSELENYQVLYDSDSSSHFLFVIDGPFDLVTNRNSLSRSAIGVFEESAFILELKKFLDEALKSLTVFSDLLKRLNREQQEAKLNQQITILEDSKQSVSERERIRLGDVDNTLYVSPRPGEEYLVGVLYASLRPKIPAQSTYDKYWKKIYTFSTQGIDSIAANNSDSLDIGNLIAIEYKYEFSSSGPFNHALCIVDFIVAWNVSLKHDELISDDFNCFGTVRKIEDGIFEIYDIEEKSGAQYQNRVVTVVCLRTLIGRTFPKATFKIPPKFKS